MGDYIWPHIREDHRSPYPQTSDPIAVRNRQHPVTRDQDMRDRGKKMRLQKRPLQGRKRRARARKGLVEQNGTCRLDAPQPPPLTKSASPAPALHSPSLRFTATADLHGKYVRPKGRLMEWRKETGLSRTGAPCARLLHLELPYRDLRIISCQGVMKGGELSRKRAFHQKYQKNKKEHASSIALHCVRNLCAVYLYYMK